jgi:hypothetical protein
VAADNNRWLIKRIVLAALARYKLVASESHASDLRRSYRADAPHLSEVPQ